MTEKFYLEDILSQKAELQKMMAHYRSCLLYTSDAADEL